jgi:hypothetical protein
MKKQQNHEHSTIMFISYNIYIIYVQSKNHTNNEQMHNVRYPVVVTAAVNLETRNCWPIRDENSERRPIGGEKISSLIRSEDSYSVGR